MARGLSSDRVHKRLYASARWRQVRASVLLASPLCSCADCRRTGAARVASVVHHVRPHGGDPALFYDVANLQALNKSCR